MRRARHRAPFEPSRILTNRPQPLHLAFAGKGGAGKSVISATAARLLARRGHRVLALDSDPLPGMAFSLGCPAVAEPPLRAAAERDEGGRWHLRRGVGPMRAVQSYAVAAPDGVRMLQVGKSGRERETFTAASTAFHALVHRIPSARGLRTWAVVGDLSAGTRQIALGWAPYARRVVVVVEPTAQSILTSRRIARIAAERGATRILLVASKTTGPRDVARIEQALGLPTLAAVPLDEHVREAERRGIALLDHAPDAPAVAAVEGLVDRLEAGRLPGR